MSNANDNNSDQADDKQHDVAFEDNAEEEDDDEDCDDDDDDDEEEEEEDHDEDGDNSDSDHSIDLEDAPSFDVAKNAMAHANGLWTSRGIRLEGGVTRYESCVLFPNKVQGSSGGSLSIAEMDFVRVKSGDGAAHDLAQIITLFSDAGDGGAPCDSALVRWCMDRDSMSDEEDLESGQARAAMPTSRDYALTNDQEEIDLANVVAVAHPLEFNITCFFDIEAHKLHRVDFGHSSELLDLVTTDEITEHIKQRQTGSGSGSSSSSSPPIVPGALIRSFADFLCARPGAAMWSTTFGKTIWGILTEISEPKALAEDGGCSSDVLESLVLPFLSTSHRQIGHSKRLESTPSIVQASCCTCCNRNASVCSLYDITIEDVKLNAICTVCRLRISAIQSIVNTLHLFYQEFESELTLGGGSVNPAWLENAYRAVVACLSMNATKFTNLPDDVVVGQDE